MLANTLNTNEIKNAAGVEVEFHRINSDGRTTEFAQINESPSLPYRLSVKHAETGTGIEARRRSVVRFDKTVLGGVDSLKTAHGSLYIVGDFPIGNLSDMTMPRDLIANMIALLSTTGAATTCLFDGTGTAAQVLLSGSL